MQWPSFKHVKKVAGDYGTRDIWAPLVGSLDGSEDEPLRWRRDVHLSNGPRLVS